MKRTIYKNTKIYVLQHAFICSWESNHSVVLLLELGFFSFFPFWSIEDMGGEQPPPNPNTPPPPSPTPKPRLGVEPGQSCWRPIALPNVQQLGIEQCFIFTRIVNNMYKIKPISLSLELQLLQPTIMQSSLILLRKLLNIRYMKENRLEPWEYKRYQSPMIGNIARNNIGIKTFNRW